MKKQTLFVAAVFAAAAAFAAEPVNLVLNGDFSEGGKHWQSRGKFDAQAKNLTVKYYNSLTSAKPIKIDPKANYKLSVKLASTVPGAMYCGLVPLDKDGKIIYTRNVSIVTHSDTTLLEPLAVGADTVKIKKAPNWTKRSYPCIAFNTKADRSDLPNYETSAISEIKTQADCIEIKLKSKATKAYPAGTAVRMHTDGATYIYLIRFPKEAITESTVLTGMIGPKDKNNRFRNGTDSVKLYFYVAGKTAKAVIEEIKFEKLDGAAPAAK